MKWHVRKHYEWFLGLKYSIHISEYVSVYLYYDSPEDDDLMFYFIKSILNFYLHFLSFKGLGIII